MTDYFVLQSRLRYASSNGRAPLYYGRKSPAENIMDAAWMEYRQAYNLIHHWMPKAMARKGTPVDVTKIWQIKPLDDIIHPTKIVLADQLPLSIALPRRCETNRALFT